MRLGLRGAGGRWPTFTGFVTLKFMSQGNSTGAPNGSASSNALEIESEK